MFHLFLHDNEVYGSKNLATVYSDRSMLNYLPWKDLQQKIAKNYIVKLSLRRLSSQRILIHCWIR